MASLRLNMFLSEYSGKRLKRGKWQKFLRFVTAESSHVFSLFFFLLLLRFYQQIDQLPQLITNWDKGALKKSNNLRCRTRRNSLGREFTGGSEDSFYNPNHGEKWDGVGEPKQYFVTVFTSTSGHQQVSQRIYILRIETYVFSRPFIFIILQATFFFPWASRGFACFENETKVVEPIISIVPSIGTFIRLTYSEFNTDRIIKVI